MSELDRLHEIIDTLPARQIDALLTLLDKPRSIDDEEFARLLAEAPEDAVDEETAARILAAEADQGESISHDELKRSDDKPRPPPPDLKTNTQSQSATRLPTAAVLRLDRIERRSTTAALCPSSLKFEYSNPKQIYETKPIDPLFSTKAGTEANAPGRGRHRSALH